MLRVAARTVRRVRSATAVRVPRRALSSGHHMPPSAGEIPPKPARPYADPQARARDVRFQVIDGAREDLNSYALKAHATSAKVAGALFVGFAAYLWWSDRSRAALKEEEEKALKRAFDGAKASRAPHAPMGTAAAAAAAAEDDDEFDAKPQLTADGKRKATFESFEMPMDQALALAAASGAGGAPPPPAPAAQPAAEAKALPKPAAKSGGIGEAHASSALPASALPADAPRWVVQHLTDAEWGVYDPYRESSLRSESMAKHFIRGALKGDGLLEGHWLVVRNTPYPLPLLPATPVAPPKHAGADASATAAASPALPAQLPEGRAVYKLGDRMCGHPGLIHGGLTSALIDSVTGALANAVHRGNLTANLNINYRRPIPASSYVLVRTRVTAIERRKIFIEAVVEDAATTPPTVFADAKALYVMMDERSRDVAAAAAAKVGTTTPLANPPAPASAPAPAPQA